MPQSCSQSSLRSIPRLRVSVPLSIYIFRALPLVYLMAMMMIPHVQAATYQLAKEYAGLGFFDEWTFYDHYDDLTDGYAYYVSASTAASERLAYVDPATNRAIVKVDNTSVVRAPEKRKSVRMMSKASFAPGSVWVADFWHVPFGCSVWPAWWSSGRNWPEDGEIDTFEGVNQITNNQMALHTSPGCTSVSPNQTSNVTLSANCDASLNGNLGCAVVDPRPASYGAPFAEGGGGVFVTEFATSGISIWFFPRAVVPASISSLNTTTTRQIDTATLGTPVANWPSQGCATEQFFKSQNLVLNIALCGDAAGDPRFRETCTGVCYDSVLGDGSNYADAYFDVAYIRAYTLDGRTGAASGAATALMGRTVAGKPLLVGVLGILGVLACRWMVMM